MTPRTIVLPLIAATVFAAAFADDFQLSDLDDGKWEFERGSPDCPKELKIGTESAQLSADVLEAAQDGGALSDCTGDGIVDLEESPTGGNAFQKAIVADKDSDVSWGAAQTGNLTCGEITFPPATYWLFFSPEDDFDVNPSETLGGTTALFAAGSDEDFSFEEDHEYLVLGKLCLYVQEGRAEAIVESADDLVDGIAEDVSSTIGGIIASDDEESVFSKPVDDSGNACFPARATVETAGGGVKRMDEIQIGDEVKVGPGAFSRVFMFTHKTGDTNNNFVSIATDSGARVELTPGHYIYVNDNLVAAATVKVGDKLRLSDGSDATVSTVSAVQLAGLYNPQTVSGDIAVEGVVSSTYTTTVKPVFAHALLSPMRAFSRVFGFEMVALESGRGWLTRLARWGNFEFQTHTTSRN